MERSIETQQMDGILDVYTEVMKSILLLAQSSLPESQFKAFRKIVLDRFAVARQKVLSFEGTERAGLVKGIRCRKVS